MTDDPDDRHAVRIRRLCYRAGHTGMREIDLILGGFARAHLHEFDDDGLDRFEVLMSHAEADLFAWIAGSVPPSESLDRGLLRRIRAFRPGHSL
ncbi:MAG: succinate dehydrogenase assembly factor 2 [Alphaproteobacteria bacterium]